MSTIDPVEHTARIERYRRVERWARRRAMTGANRWVTTWGRCPSRYTVIEELAAERYLHIERRRTAGWTLRLAASEILPFDVQADRVYRARLNAAGLTFEDAA